MSRAWYSSRAPELLKSFVSQSGQREVQVWNTTCAVMKAGKTSAMACTVLINPANPQLSGVSKFPYFPRGGPVPKYPNKDAHHIMGHVSQWGGMEVGHGMLFAANVVDGLVHQMGGWKLAFECGRLPVVDANENARCPVGQAVVTGPGGPELKEHFDFIVHTVPPFFSHHNSDPATSLLDCYKNSLKHAFERSPRVACPLLGAGCRGFPLDVAISVASQASLAWCDEDNAHGDNPQHLAFAIPDPEIADELVKAIETTRLRSNDTVVATTDLKGGKFRTPCSIFQINLSCSHSRTWFLSWKDVDLGGL